MKRYSNIIIFGLIIVVIILNSIDSSPRSDGFHFSTVTRDEPSIPISDSLPHYRYQRALDSFKLVNKHLQERPVSTRSGTNLGNVGVYEGESSNEHHVSLTGYQRKPWVEFFRKGEINFIREPVWDSTWERDGEKMASGHYVTKETKVLFIEKDKNAMEGRLLLPISKGAFQFWNNGILIIGILMTAAILVMVFPAFFRFLFDIAKGNAFTKRNTRRLTRIALVFIVVGLLEPLSQLIFYFIYKDMIPPSIYFSWLEWFQSDSSKLLAGLLTLLLANAFKQGYELAKDRDLTI